MFDRNNHCFVHGFVSAYPAITAIPAIPAICSDELRLFFAIFTVLWLSLYLFGGGVGSSSKRSLLAHDGWSEIWEIALLKSGDVERNPGPTYMTGTIQAQ